MAESPDEGTAVIVIRLWLEPHHERPLRARLSRAGEPSLRTSVTVSSADEVCDVVRAWIEQFATGPRETH